MQNKETDRRKSASPRVRSRLRGFFCVNFFSPALSADLGLPLRRIRVYDAEHHVTLVLLTNQFDVAAAVIAELYRKRWQVELFFKWIKQHLRIRSFYGRSENAVRFQIWSALCAYLMVAIVRKQFNLQKRLTEILQIVSVNIFEQTPLAELLGSPLPLQGQIIGDHHTQNLLWPND